MSDIIITVVSGETTNLGLSIPGVQGPIGGDTMPSGGSAGQILVKQSATNYDAAWTFTASGLTLRSSTASGLTLQGTVSGGTFVASTISGAAINVPVISSGTIDGTAITNVTGDALSIINSNVDSSTIFASTLSGVITNVSSVNGGTYSSGTFSSPSLISPTISGTIAASGGVTVFASGASAGFFGASPVVCPSGIVIPSGGSSTAEVLTALSGVIVALRNLGLVRS